MDNVVKNTRAGATADAPAGEQAADKSTPAPEFIGEVEHDSYPLKHPLKWNGQEYREVEFAPLRGSAFHKLKLVGPVVGEDAAMVHLVTGLPVEIVQALHADDYVEVLERIPPFIPARFLEGTGSAPT